MFQELKIGVFQFTLEVGPKGLDLPSFYGSTFRGAFGNAFKQIACASQELNICRGCMVEHSCPYAYIFETSPTDDLAEFIRYDDVPRPFVFCPELKGRTHYKPGETFEVEVRIFGKALSYLPYFVLAFNKMGERGLGYRRQPVLLKEVYNVNPIQRITQLVYDGTQNKIFNVKEIITGPMLLEQCPDHAQKMTVSLKTPLRVKENGDLVRTIEFHHVARSLIRRASAIMLVHHDVSLDIDFTRLSAKSYEVKRTRDLTKWWDLARYSQRQGGKMKLGGVIGEVLYKGDLNEFLPFFEFGRWVGVGKSTVFGLGQMDYEVGS